MRDDQKTDRLIVKFKKQTDKKLNSSRDSYISNLKIKYEVNVLNFSKKTHDQAEVWLLDQMIDNKKLEAFASDLKKNSQIEYAEPDYISNPLFIPNDTYYANQYYLRSDFVSCSGDDCSQYFGYGTESAWNVANGSNVTVAVLDTGYLPHTDLVPNYILNTDGTVFGYDFISSILNSNDGNGADSNPIDSGDYNTATGKLSSWHGTQVSGVIAAVANNSKGTAGIAFNSKILPVRVAGAQGAYDSDIANGIIWAGKYTSYFDRNKSKIINISLGGTNPCSTTLQNAINQSAAVVVVAAGNGNVDASTTSPANCDNVIPVGSIDPNGYKSSFSNYGSKITYVGFGEQIYVPSNAGTLSATTENYVSANGTSFSAPSVAGVLALIMSNPSGLFLNNRSNAIRRMQETSLPVTCFEPSPASCYVLKYFPSAKNALNTSWLFVSTIYFSSVSSETNTLNSQLIVEKNYGTAPYTYTWSLISSDPRVTLSSTTAASPILTFTTNCGSQIDIQSNVTVRVSVKDSLNHTSTFEGTTGIVVCSPPDNGGG